MNILREKILQAAGFDINDRNICLAKIKENGYNIRFIRNPDKEVQLASVRKNLYSIKHIRNPDKEVQLEAVRQDGDSIQYIHSPDKEVQMEAIKQSDYNIGVILLCPDWKELEEEIENALLCKEIIE